MRFSRSTTSTATRHEIFDEQNGLCAACDEPLSKAWQVDHIKPLALGGSNDFENLQGLCARCHSSKTTDDRKAIANKPKHKSERYLAGLEVKEKKQTFKRRWPSRMIPSRAFPKKRVQAE